MNSKKFMTLSGTLMLPLRIGCRALILHEGGYTYTSSVVVIHSIQPGEICFETKNTHYRLLPVPESQAADNRSFMSMAA